MGVVVMFLAKLVQDYMTPYKIGEQLTHKDNVALAVSITGYYLGIIIVFLGSLYQPLAGIRPVADSADVGAWNLGFTADYWQDVLGVFVYALVGIVVLNIARIVVDKLVLYKFSTEKEIITDQNVGTGVVEAGVYIAVGLVIAGSISGQGGGPETTVAFLGLGLLVLVLYTLFYELTTSFDLHEEIERDNTAVGVALAGNMIAVGIVSLKAVFGDFVGWSEALAGFITFAVIGFVLLYVVRMIVDFVLFPRVSVAHELAVDRNLGVAFIMAGSVISVSTILFFAV
jgi:uncharacterized membrane protein YjfL (UPF0719 family)